MLSYLDRKSTRSKYVYTITLIGELRIGRVSGELTSGECDEIDGERDEIDGNAAYDKRR
ncbi:hypothetical protein YC2023_040447 [Brassica napus]